MLNQRNMIIFIILVFSCLNILPSIGLDSQSTTFSINAENKDLDSINEIKKINELLDSLEKGWNEHNIKNVESVYSNEFINGDGIPLDSVKKLTTELWEAYPDIKSKSQERTVRVYGDYATVDSNDRYEGTSSMIREDVGSKGHLQAISIGQLFLKKFGPTWKISSDRTILEEVNIGYGLGTELISKNKIILSAPEQVAAGQQYTATLEFDLPGAIKPVAAISKEILVYPQISAEDKFRLINESKLEKFIASNKINKNELITATVGLTGEILKPKLLGLVFLTKRVNVIAVSGELSETSIITTSAKSALIKSAEELDIYPNEQKQKDKKEESLKE